MRSIRQQLSAVLGEEVRIRFYLALQGHHISLRGYVSLSVLFFFHCFQWRLGASCLPSMIFPHASRLWLVSPEEGLDKEKGSCGKVCCGQPAGTIRPSVRPWRAPRRGLSRAAEQAASPQCSSLPRKSTRWARQRQ